LKLKKRSGDELFSGGGSHPPISVLGFWQWAASDLLSNAMRGVLAEYIVANALGLAGGVRTEWDALDLRMANGRTIEIKSAANVVTAERKRQADIYIFCLLNPQRTAFNRSNQS
jgi:hypothetical protein